MSDDEKEKEEPEERKDDKGSSKSDTKSKSKKDWLLYGGVAAGGVLLFILYEWYKNRNSNSTASTSTTGTNSTTPANSNKRALLGALLKQSTENGMMIDQLSLQNWSADGALQQDITGTNSDFKKPTWRPNHVVHNEWWITHMGGPKSASIMPQSDQAGSQGGDQNYKANFSNAGG